MKRSLAIILVTLGGLLLSPIIWLHVIAMLPRPTNLAVVAPSVAIAIHVLTATGLVLIVSGLAGLILPRRRRLP
jgi:uncharacterized membrane protein